MYFIFHLKVTLSAWRNKEAAQKIMQEQQQLYLLVQGTLSLKKTTALG